MRVVADRDDHGLGVKAEGILTGVVTGWMRVIIQMQAPRVGQRVSLHPAVSVPGSIYPLWHDTGCQRSRDITPSGVIRQSLKTGALVGREGVITKLLLCHVSVMPADHC